MAVVLNLLADFIISFIVANLAVSAAVSLLGQKFLKVQVKPRKAFLWLMVLIPWLVSALISLYLLDDYVSSIEFEMKAYAHWGHMTDFEWYSWHGVTLILALGFTLCVCTNKLIQLFKHRREINMLSALSTEVESDVYQIETPQAYAFATGFINKKCFVTTGLVKATSGDEYDVVISHERAHAKSNDPLKKWLFSVFSGFFAPTIGARLKLHMVLAMEQDADNEVIKSGKDKIFVASTLMKIAKLNAKDKVLSNSDLIVNFGADVLEQRIFFLLDQLQLEPMNKSLTAVFVILLSLICMTSLDGVHHFIEAIFSHQ